jgi:arylsulfatase A-like enzyme
MDIAPTVLALLDLAPPVDLDGRILSEALQEPHVPPSLATTADWTPAPVQAYAPSEAVQMEARLRSLGYLE